MGRIFLSKADVTAVEERYVLDALQSGWIAPLGPHVDAFEAEIAERVGVAGALAVSSGTAALHLALLHVGARPGTHVIVSSMTFAASANAVVYTGATPVFVDSQASDGNVDPNLLLEAVDTLRAEDATVAAVMTVDLFGRCADYDNIAVELEAREIPLIEDAAEALGASHGGRQAGSFGQAAALSFNGNKIMTTSGGGMLLSDDVALLDRARYLSSQARQPVPWYEHTEIGYNYRMSNILAALGRGQLTRLDEMIARRRKIRKLYAEGLADIPGVEVIGGTGGTSDNCWLTSIALDDEVVTISPEALISELSAQEIEARHLWKPMHAQPVFAGARSFLNGVSDRLFETGLTLPSGSALTDDEVQQVLCCLRGALKPRTVYAGNNAP
jgi:dTDP-4-amino-4,6-dideoxygalactose transaminase